MIAALIALVVMAAGSPATLPDIEDEVMCVICGTALNVSSAPAAERQREFIRRRIDEGMTKDEVKDALVAEYGPDVLALPERRGIDLAGYGVPILAVIAGLGGIALVLRRGRAARTGPAATGAAPPAGPELDPADAARLDADLAAYDR
jgi:cytochrome c-type biogenesis protein CcmH